MSCTIHKTFGAYRKSGLQGYQFNYPYEGCVFDKNKQRFAFYKKGLTDEDLRGSFLLDSLFLTRSIIEMSWQPIESIIRQSK